MSTPRQISTTFCLSAELVAALNRMADRLGHPRDALAEEALRGYVFRSPHPDIAAALDAEQRRRGFTAVPPGVATDIS
jgi:predicted transcriptional regulator